MLRNYFFTALLFLTGYANLAAQQIAAAEYFFNTDPGPGNGISIPVILSDTLNQTVNINVSSLPPGFHNVFIRTKNTLGAWSHYQGRTFYITASTATLVSQPQLTSGEWFIDTDPGLGNGTAIPGITSDTLKQTANINVSSMSPGFHNIFIRTKNALGLWSHYQGRTFYITPTATVALQPQLVSGEWFIDTDPGLGNASSFTFTPADSINAVINPNIGSLAYGSTHHLFIRTKNASGAWSHYEGRQFSVCPGVPSFTGTVTSTAGPVTGNIILYKHETFLTHLDSIDFAPIQANGSYSFGPVNSGTYIAKAVPTGTNMQVTYAGSAVSWQGATQITYSCATTYTQNIAVQTFTNLAIGTGTLSGKITEGDGFDQKPGKVMQPGNPIGGIIVKGGKNPGGNMFAQTTTNDSGEYSFGNVPPGNYFILVDVPGLDTNLTYHPTITVTDNQFTDLNFVIDSMYVHPIPGSDVGITTLEKMNEYLSVMPNPFHSQITITNTKQDIDIYSLSIVDILGKTIIIQDSNKSIQVLQLPDLASGIYYLTIQENNGNRITKKLIKI